MPAKFLSPLAQILALVLALASAGCRAAPDPDPAPAPPRLGLMTTLPLYWSEAAGVGELLQNGKTSWVREALETRYALEPLDTLDDASFAGMDRLVLAQPRALSPAENVALDGWVRAGGKLLLFADPMLTRESRFGIGDRRRPQDVILLSPILAHWGLELTLDADQPEEERVVEVFGIALPVALPGALGISPGAACEIAGEAIVATCRIGRGTVTVIADAAVLDDAKASGPEQRRAALLALVAHALD